jgi:hypothetical protein
MKSGSAFSIANFTALPNLTVCWRLFQIKSLGLYFSETSFSTNSE